jgi:signal transduction histidine kinase
MELGKIAYEAVDFDLALVTREVAEGMRQHAAQRGLALRPDVGQGERLPVRADLTKVRETIRNLIDNAIKYTRAGSVTISADRQIADARVTIKDTGVGIEAEAMASLFNKFSRADAQNVNRQGSGIGLYLAKIFIEAQGGRVWAESAGTGAGSSFYIELPLGG